MLDTETPETTRSLDKLRVLAREAIAEADGFYDDNAGVISIPHETRATRILLELFTKQLGEVAEAMQNVPFLRMGRK